MGNTRRRKTFLLTLEGLIAVIGLCVTCFSTGYAIGKDSENKNNRRSSKKQTVIFIINTINGATACRYCSLHIQYTI